MEQICVKPMSFKMIQETAQRLRELVGAENNYEFPVLQFVEWILCNPESGIQLEIVPVSEMNGMYGLTNTNSDVLKIREDAYLGAYKGNPRDIFTLCHEVGHYFLHQPNRVEFARGDIPAYRNPEWQANAFAACLMAPYNLVKDMSAKEISTKCNMSLQAASIHRKNLNKHYGV